MGSPALSGWHRFNHWSPDDLSNASFQKRVSVFVYLRGHVQNSENFMLGLNNLKGVRSPVLDLSCNFYSQPYFPNKIRELPLIPSLHDWSPRDFQMARLLPQKFLNLLIDNLIISSTSSYPPTWRQTNTCRFMEGLRFYCQPPAGLGPRGTRTPQSVRIIIGGFRERTFKQRIINNRSFAKIQSDSLQCKIKYVWKPAIMCSELRLARECIVSKLLYYISGKKDVRIVKRDWYSMNVWS